MLFRRFKGVSHHAPPHSPPNYQEELGDKQFQRRIALTVRKHEEYPSEQFDENLIELLEQTSPCIDGEEPLEMVVKEPIIVYRGEIDKSVHMGLSWTTSLEIAKRFAGRFGKQGSIFKTVLEPKEILAAYADDGEHEVPAIVLGEDINAMWGSTHEISFTLGGHVSFYHMFPWESPSISKWQDVPSHPLKLLEVIGEAPPPALSL